MFKETIVMSTTIETHVNAVNKAVRAYRKGSQTLFSAIFNAWKDLTGPDFDKFKEQVDCDSSTINKTLKIVACRWVMNNLDRLPVAWSTLSVIATNYKEYGKKLERALEEGELNRKSTAKQVREILEIPSSEATQSYSPKITYNPRNYSDEDKAELEPILEKLEDRFGFKICVPATNSEEPDSPTENSTEYDEVKEEQMKEAA